MILYFYRCMKCDVLSSVTYSPEQSYCLCPICGEQMVFLYWQHDGMQP